MVRLTQAKRLLERAAIAPGRNLINVTAGPRGEIVALSSDREITHYLRARDPVGYRITQWGRPGLSTLDLPIMSEPLAHVQPLGADRWLLARARARNSDDRNAHIFDSSGHLTCSFPLGDAVEDVQATVDGTFWVSYFDEGIYSGWGLSASGAVLFDVDGEPLLKYLDVVSRNGVPPIGCCYAMNVASKRDAWLYYYGDFPLVRLRDRHFHEKWLDVPVHGAHAFAIASDRVLFAGSYGASESLYLMSLATMAVEEL